MSWASIPLCTCTCDWTGGLPGCFVSVGCVLMGVDMAGEIIEVKNTIYGTLLSCVYCGNPTALSVT